MKRGKRNNSKRVAANSCNLSDIDKEIKGLIISLKESKSQENENYDAFQRINAKLKMLANQRKASEIRKVMNFIKDDPVNIKHYKIFSSVLQSLAVYRTMIFSYPFWLFAEVSFEKDTLFDGNRYTRNESIREILRRFDQMLPSTMIDLNIKRKLVVEMLATHFFLFLNSLSFLLYSCFMCPKEKVVPRMLEVIFINMIAQSFFNFTPGLFVRYFYLSTNLMSRRLIYPSRALSISFALIYVYIGLQVMFRVSELLKFQCKLHGTIAQLNKSINVVNEDDLNKGKIFMEFIRIVTAHEKILSTIEEKEKELRRLILERKLITDELIHKNKKKPSAKMTSQVIERSMSTEEKIDTIIDIHKLFLLTWTLNPAENDELAVREVVENNLCSVDEIMVDLNKIIQSKMRDRCVDRLDDKQPNIDGVLSSSIAFSSCYRTGSTVSANKSIRKNARDIDYAILISIDILSARNILMESIQEWEKRYQKSLEEQDSLRVSWPSQFDFIKRVPLSEKECEYIFYLKMSYLGRDIDLTVTGVREFMPPVSTVRYYALEDRRLGCFSSHPSNELLIFLPRIKTLIIE